MKILILSADLPFEISDLIRENLINVGYEEVMVFSNPFIARHYLNQEPNTPCIIFDYNMKDTGLDVSSYLSELLAAFPALRMVIVVWEEESVLERFTIHPIVCKRDSEFCDKLIHQVNRLAAKASKE